MSESTSQRGAARTSIRVAMFAASLTALGGAALAACHRTPSGPGAAAQHEAQPSSPPAAQPGTAGPDSPASSGAAPGAPPRYSPFGGYAPLPAWSGWCGSHADVAKCAEPLQRAVAQQSPQSRPTVRQHGFFLWASIWSPLAPERATPAGGRNDAREQRTSLYGTTGCWSKFADGSAACSGVYPIWLTWPNTGKPYAAAAAEAPSNAAAASTDGSAAAAAPSAAAASSAVPSAAVPSAAAPSGAHEGKTLRTKRRAYSAPAVKGDPDPTQKQTVNTDTPTYALPPLTLSKQCGMTPQQASRLLAEQKYADISAACAKAGAAGVFCPPAAGQPPAICDGSAFVNQGDVMIATESLSAEGYEEIQKNALYDQSVLASMYQAKQNTIPELLSRRFISTKHMFWPVKGCKPGVKVGEEGCRIRYGALPPWVPKDFRKISYATNADYLGYERWKSVVAIDTCEPAAGAECTKGNEATLQLEYVKGARPITTKNPTVYPARSFQHLQVSDEVLKRYFTATDRALLDQATIWAYGDKSNGFEAGDFLVVAAMHVNTKEVPSWAFQSVWWSPMSDSLTDCPLEEYDHCFGQTGGYAATAATGSTAPNRYSGLTEAQITSLDAHVGGNWRAQYLMTDSYGINYELDGTPVSVSSYFKGKPPAWASVGPTGQPLPLFPVSANVYIEPVIHPLGTECQNCHRRAGYPGKACAKGEYPGGCGRSSYQTAQCPDLLGDYGAPAVDACMTTPWAWHSARGNDCKAVDGTLCNGKEAFPVLNTDWVWIIADSHVQKR